MNEQMEVLDKSGKPVSNVYCIGDANGTHQGSYCGVDSTVIVVKRHASPVCQLDRYSQTCYSQY